MKSLILTDPYRIKSTAETISVKFHVPVGCQLITIYIPQSEYTELMENGERMQTMCMNQDGNNINTTYPLQFKKKIMKRDKSIVFTNIPEECHESGTSNCNRKTDGGDNADNDVDNNQKIKIVTNNEGTLKFTPQPTTQRPNHLPLRFKNITSKDIPESGFSSSITFDEHDSFPQFIGRTSVCSTPMTENKVLHGNILPICGNPFNEKSILPNNNNSNSKSIPNDIINCSPPSILPSESQTPEKILLNNLENFNKNCSELPDNFINTLIDPFGQQRRRNSLIDIRETFKKFVQHLSIRPISNGFANFMHECDYIADGRKFHSLDVNGSDKFNKNSMHLNNHICDDSDDFDSDAIDDIVHKNQYKTITDPTYPVFNSNGQPISQFLFEQIMNQQNRENLNNNFNSNKSVLHTNDTNTDKVESKPNSNCSTNSKNTDIKIETAMKSIEKPPFTLNNNNINRKSLSLPLKSLTLSNNNTDTKINNSTAITAESNVKNIFTKAEDRKKLSGIQLTPLITKLSILAMSEERSSGFSSWDATPGIEIATPIDSAKLFRRRSSVKAEDTDQIQHSDSSRSIGSFDENNMKKVELFICGQNNMTMLMLLQENFSQKQENIQALVRENFESININ